MLNEIADPAVDEPVHGHINNQFYSDSTGMRPRTTEIEQPKLNTVEEWDIVNTTGDAHPIHLHLTQFRILNRQQFDEPAYTAAVNTQLPAPGLPDPSVSGQGPWPALSANRYLLGHAHRARGQRARLEGHRDRPARTGHPDPGPVRGHRRRRAGTRSPVTPRARACSGSPAPTCSTATSSSTRTTT